MDLTGSPERQPGHFADDGDAIARASECFNFLRSVPILFEIPDTALWDIARSAEPIEFPAGTRVVAEGNDESAKRFYVIRSGSADVVRRDRAGITRTVARLSVGSYFGELGLLTNQARNATIRVHGDSPLRAYGFDALTFHRRIAEQVLVFRVLRDRSSDVEGRDGAPLDMERLGAADEPRGRGRMRIKELALLDRLPEPDLSYVLEHAEHRWHPDGTTIVEQGDPGDRFYVLLEGGVTVNRDQTTLATLEPGQFFGETALLLDMPRTATVRAEGNALTWSITRSAFQRLVGSYLMSNPRTQEEIMRRMAEVLPATNPPSNANPDPVDQ